MAAVAPENGGTGKVASYVGTVALVGLGVALIEEELLAGMAIGVAAMAAPSLVPKLGAAFRPLLKSAIRAGYGVAARTRETVAEMSEQFEDVMAEVRAEQGMPEAAGTADHSAAGAHPGSPQAAGSGPHPVAHGEGEPERGKRGSRQAPPTPEST